MRGDGQTCWRRTLRRLSSPPGDQDALDAEIASWAAAQEHYDAFHALQAAGVPSSSVTGLRSCDGPSALGARLPEDAPPAGTHRTPEALDQQHVRDAAAIRNTPPPWASTMSTSTRSLLAIRTKSTLVRRQRSRRHHSGREAKRPRPLAWIPYCSGDLQVATRRRNLKCFRSSS